jgi:hypothetical protein
MPALTYDAGMGRGRVWVQEAELLDKVVVEMCRSLRCEREYR